MAARKGAANRFNPVRGWVTEGNLAQYGQDVALDVENMHIEKTGLTQRRLGLFAETGTSSFLGDTFDAGARASGLISIKEWREAWGEEDVNLLVIQAGTTVYVLQDTAPLVDANIVETIDLTEAGIKLDGVIDSPVHVAIGNGFAIITNPRINPVLITLEDVTNLGAVTLSSQALNLEIRSRDLLTPFTEGESYGSTLSAAEEFNLYNSGWPYVTAAAETSEGRDTLRTNPIAWYHSKRGVYPTHSKLFKSMKLDTAIEAFALDSFNAFADVKINFGNTTPPLGKFIHNAYNFNSRDLIDAWLAEPAPSPPGGSIPPQVEGAPIASGTVSWTISDRPRCAGYHNGHVYFADRDQNGKTRILVSQLVSDLSNIAKCYQDADPTAEEINDLIATDGFTVHPVGMGAPLAMVEYNKRLLILATNGVWSIRGTSGGGATATDFTLDKVASVDFNAPHSVVDVGTAILFWSERGILAIGTNDFGDLTSNNLTENTIDEYYDSLDRDVIKSVKGTFINDENRVYWTVPAKQDANGQYASDAELVLILNLDTGGFYKHTVSGGPVLHAPFRRLNNTRTTVQVNVTETDGTIVTDTMGNPVTTSQVVTSTGKDGLAYYASNDGASGFFTFVAVHYNYGFADWGNVPNVGRTDYLSFVDFAYEYPEVMIGNISMPYIHSYYLTGIRVDTSGSSGFGGTWNFTTETAHVSFHRVEQLLTPEVGTVSFHRPEEMITPSMQVVSFHRDDIERIETGLLSNGDAETGTADWISAEFGTRSSSPAPYEGTAYFWGPNNVDYQAYQDIDLVGGGFIGATEAADKVIEAKISWWARGSQNDRGHVSLEARTALGIPLASVGIGEYFIGHGDAWCRYAHALVLPAGTAELRVTIEGEYNASNDVNYYVDDIQVTLEVHNS